jgi:pimeloyl-ACP methyl ester carboxylesterase
MPTTVLDLAEIAGAVYDGVAVGEWKPKSIRKAWEGLLVDGLQAAHYRRGSESVIAFRGTNLSWRLISSAQDLLADLTLGSGMNSGYFRAAENFVSKESCGPDVVLCGHSLGGAIAQIVGNRMGLRFATFNAPGVAVWASRNISEANPVMLGIRTVGMIASAVADPFQAGRDVASAMRVARGLNVRLSSDRVSKYGIHYGAVIDVASIAPESAGELEKHSIKMVVDTLRHPRSASVSQRLALDFK